MCKQVVPKSLAYCFKNVNLCVDCFKQEFVIEPVEEREDDVEA